MPVHLPSEMKKETEDIIKRYAPRVPSEKENNTHHYAFGIAKERRTGYGGPSMTLPEPKCTVCGFTRDGHNFIKQDHRFTLVKGAKR